MSPQPSAARIFLTEFAAVSLWISTTLLVFVLTTTPVLPALAPPLAAHAPLHVFLALLLAIMAVWDMFGLALGSPLNPAVTLALAVAGELPPSRVPLMWPAQFLAHAFGVLAVRVAAPRLLSGVEPAVFLPPQPHVDLSYAHAVAVEAMLTAVLCLVALSLKHVFADDAKVAKFSVMNGLVIAVLAGGGEWTGSCMNPAMHFALSFFEGHWVKHSVYWVGPFLGALVGGLVYNLLFRRKSEGKKKGKPNLVVAFDQSKAIKTE